MYASLAGSDNTADGFKGGTFAGTISANQGDDLSFLYGERNSLKGVNISVKTVNAIYFK
jgi:hypothetical protein